MSDLGKLIVTKDFKKWPKVQKIAKSGHMAVVVVVVKGQWAHLILR